MATNIQLAQVILQQDGFRDKEWKEVSLLSTGAQLGNFVKKRLSKYFLGLAPSLEKYYYDLQKEKLEEFLEKQKGRTFSLGHPCLERKTLTQCVYEEKVGFVSKVAALAGGETSNERKRSIPSRELEQSWINRSTFEKELKLWKMDMESDYIKTMKEEGCIPCIVSEIVEAMKPNDETDCKASLVEKQTREANLKLGKDVLDVVSNQLEGKLTYERMTEEKACVSGPVLYKVLPLEVNVDGGIAAKENSKGFKEERLASDGTAGNFSCSPADPTLQSSFDKVEKWLKLIISNQAVADAFKSVTSEDIHNLCCDFGNAEKSCNDVKLLDKKMSKNRQEILLFAKFESKESGMLTLKEKFIVNPPQTFIASYYLAVIMSDILPTMHQLLKQCEVNMFPLLKDILLYGKSSEGITVSEDVWNSTNAMDLLKMLEIDVHKSTVVAIPTSLERLTSVVWIAMLYGGTDGAIQQQ
ncbi:uncharacterized protein LOC117319468 isoform X2 [Pecten maximus]|uniref:uncharacterized protein LOC117319468 isoform X2 n=1 Tax=Pecten maximus TaxID=6579 RepID=UPI0014589D16|nr:uncharacterized protein LOC117319468 isoform X2 [Pecten maximus]